MNAGATRGVETLRRVAATGSSAAEVREAVYALLTAADEPGRSARPRRTPEGHDAAYGAAVDGALSGLGSRLAERERLRAQAEETASRLAEIRRVSPEEVSRRGVEISGALRRPTIEDYGKNNDHETTRPGCHTGVQAVAGGHPAPEPGTGGAVG